MGEVIFITDLSSLVTNDIVFQKNIDYYSFFESKTSKSKYLKETVSKNWKSAFSTYQEIVNRTMIIP